MRKKFLFYAFAAMVAMGAVAVLPSCSSDDDPETPETIKTASDAVAGNYDGKLVVTLGGTEVANDAKTIKLDKDGDNSIDVEIDNFSLNVKLGTVTIPVNLGDLEVDNCALKAIDGGYTFSGSTRLNQIEVPLAPGTSMKADCDVKIEGATVKGSALSMPIVVDVYVAGSTTPLVVNVQFDGTKK